VTPAGPARDPGAAALGGAAPDATGADATGPRPEAAGGVLVIGYGNALRSDDGVGVHAAGMLARDPRLARADVRAAVQLAPELAADLAEASLVVLVDATVEAAPGEVVVRRAAGGPPVAGDPAGAGDPARAGDPPGGASGATSHHVGVEELVALAAELYGAAPEVVVVSVGVTTMDVGEALSPTVAAALPGVADAVADLVARHEGRRG
jgi:Ni,Fe-hydrogenase maturation factor